MTSTMARAVVRWWKALVAVGLFVVAVRLLGAAADDMSTSLERWLEGVVDDPLATLGSSWMLTYVLASGSVVAGVAVTLVSSAAVASSVGFLLVAGSRLGAAAFVVLLGMVEYARARPRPLLSQALGLGFLTFIVTLTVYVPATALGYAAFEPAERLLLGLLPAGDLDALARADGFTDRLVGTIGAPIVAFGAVALAIVSLRLFDGFLDGVDQEKLARRVRSWLRHRWLAFASGLVVTALTTSVAISVGGAVPLFARGLIKPRHMVPYLLGAGLGAMVDTVAVAVLLGSEDALAAVLVVMVAAALVTAVFLWKAAAYGAAVERAFEIVTGSRLVAAAFAALLAAAPVILYLQA
jgi:sodium-dependent phosphate cotransporter